MSAMDFAARSGAQEARDLAEAVVGTADSARSMAAKAEGAAQAALTASDLTSKALDASRQEMEAARKAADAAGRTAQAADTAAQAATDAADQAGRLAREAGAGAPRLFTSMSAARLPASVTAIGSNGFDKVGHGVATYVSDALATAELAAAHPLACFKGADDRYFRLLPDASDAITPEQLGCPAYVPGVNARPYVQATLDYAAAAGISKVLFTQLTYELWADIRQPGLGLDAIQGHYLVVRHAVKLIGEGSTKVQLQFLNSEGGTNDTTTQWTTLPEYSSSAEGHHDPAHYPWMGHGIVMDLGWNEKNPIDFFCMENIEMDGTHTYDAATARDRGVVNLMNKGICVPGIANIRRIRLINCDIHDFAGEIYYTAGNTNIEEEYFENVHVHGSPQCSLNPQTYATGVFVNCQFGRSFQHEIIGGRGKRFIGCRFYDLVHVSLMGGAAGWSKGFQNGYGYSWPFRDADRAPPYIYLDGLTFENCKNVELYSYLRGRIYAVDTVFGLGGGNIQVRDVALEIDATWDKRTDLAPVLSVAGPQTMVTVGGAPAGEFVEPTRDIHIKIVMHRTREAIASGRSYNCGVEFGGGLLDTGSCTFTVEGDGRQAIRALSYPNNYPAPAQATASHPRFAWPKVEVSPQFRATGPYEAFGSDKAGYPSRDFEFDLIPGNNVLYPQANGVFAMNITAPYKFQHGQRARIYHGQNDAGRIIKVQRDGGAIRLQADRYLIGRGDYLELQWDAGHNAWIESGYCTATALVMNGRTTYDAPQVAPGGSVSTKVGVWGARVGDIVTGLSFGSIDLQGLTSRGEVTSDNTVTVWLTNPTTGAPDLPSADLRVQVTKGFAA